MVLSERIDRQERFQTYSGASSVTVASSGVTASAPRPMMS